MTRNGSATSSSCPASAADFFRELRSLSFDQNVEDLMALTLARFILFGIMVKVAVKVGKIRRKEEGHAHGAGDGGSGGGGKYSLNGGRGDDGSHSEGKPLLPMADGVGASAGAGARTLKGNSKGSPADSTDADEAADEVASAAFRKRAVVGAFFLLMTSAQAFVGVKCVLFDFESAPGWHPPVGQWDQRLLATAWMCSRTLPGGGYVLPLMTPASPHTLQITTMLTYARAHNVYTVLMSSRVPSKVLQSTCQMFSSMTATATATATMITLAAMLLITLVHLQRQHHCRRRRRRRRHRVNRH